MTFKNWGVARGFAGAASILALAVAAPAWAQDAETDDGADDLIIVTGSRIATDSNLSAASPVQSISGSDITTSGQLDITTLLRETPALQGSLPGSFSAFNNAGTDDSDLGIGFLNLRSLGIRRTLVLENGRRHVAGTSGQAAVDVNTISSALLGRVEILTGGASSIYGADAVTGVVNFITRDGATFDGLETRIQAGISDDSDAEELVVAIANGWTFDDGRGDAVFAIEYTTTEPVLAGDRDFAGSGLFSRVQNTPDLAAALGIDPGFSNTFVPNLTLPISSRFGIIALGDGGASAFVESAFNGGQVGCDTLGAAAIPTCQVFDNGVLRPYVPGNFFIGPFEAIGGDAIAANPDNELILPDQNRVSINFNTSYALNDYADFFAETKFAYTDTRDTGQVNGFNDDIPIALDNPFIPAELQAQIATLRGEGLDPQIVISRDTLDTLALPNPRSERYTFRIVGGVKGELPFGLDYEVSYNYGRTDARTTTENTRIEDRFFAGIDAVRAPSGEIVCRSDIDPNAVPGAPDFPSTDTTIKTFVPGDGQCVPINIFGENAITAEAAAFAFLPTTQTTVLTQEVFLATLAGDTSAFFELPAGPIGFALGFENRKEQSDFTPDGLVQSGLTFGSNNSGPTFPAGGEYEVSEAFVEGNVPLLSDLPLVKYLEFKGSARWSNYTTIGTTTASALGFRYLPVESLTLRGTVSTSVRAPNISELFSPLQPDAIGATEDPCNPNLINSGSEFREQNCLLFVAPGFLSTNFNSAFVPGLSGGNPNLSEEEADTFTVGAVYRPNGDFGGLLDGLTVVVDYYSIEIKGLIDTLDPFDIASNCVDLPSINNQFCDQIFRDPTDGFITGFVAGEINLGAVETAGVDWSVTYEFDVPSFISSVDLGELRLSAVGTRFLKYDEFPDPADLSDVDDRLGEFGLPTWIMNFGADWYLGDLVLGWSGRYETSQLLPGIENEDLVTDPTFSNLTDTGSGFVHDISAQYQFGESLSIYGGVNNLLEVEPYLGTLSRPAGPRGRFFYVGVQKTF